MRLKTKRARGQTFCQTCLCESSAQTQRDQQTKGEAVGRKAKRRVHRRPKSSCPQVVTSLLRSRLLLRKRQERRRKGARKPRKKKERVQTVQTPPAPASLAFPELLAGRRKAAQASFRWPRAFLRMTLLASVSLRLRAPQMHLRRRCFIVTRLFSADCRSSFRPCKRLRSTKLTLPEPTPPLG